MFLVLPAKVPERHLLALLSYTLICEPNPSDRYLEFSDWPDVLHMFPVKWRGRGGKGRLFKGNLGSVAKGVIKRGSYRYKS